MVYAYILSNMAIKKVSSNTSDENFNLAINDLCRGILYFFLRSIYLCTF